MVDKGITLIIGHPLLRDSLADGQSYGPDFIRHLFLGASVPVEGFPPDVSVVEMPVERGSDGNDKVLSMIYLTPNPRVDRLISSGEWRRVPLNLH